jgi:ABC-type glutathione transport system ATPase component
MTKETLLDFIEISIKQIQLHKQISIECEVEEEILELHDKTSSIFEIVKDVVTERNLAVNYIQQFHNDLSQTLNFFTYRQHQNLSFIQTHNKEDLRKAIENQIIPLEKQLKQVNFNLDFFRKVNFFSSHIVAVGANGSGKTTLSDYFKKYLPNTGIVISAQKVLIIPTFSGVSNFNNTKQKLQQSQASDKSLKVTYSTENQGNSWGIMTQVGGEFQVLLDNLLAERSVVRNKYFDLLQNGQVVNDIPVTRLDKALKIWNSLIQHRILECVDGINITLRALKTTTSYAAHQMSDGEKVALYLIAHILQAPESGFIIVDEPEMYLHKTILKKLWDILELERQDCIFIYLTQT